MPVGGTQDAGTLEADCVVVNGVVVDLVIDDLETDVTPRDVVAVDGHAGCRHVNAEAAGGGRTADGIITDRRGGRVSGQVDAVGGLGNGVRTNSQAAVGSDRSVRPVDCIVRDGGHGRGSQ